MLTRTSTAAISAALAIGLSGAIAPAATAVPVNPLVSPDAPNAEVVVDPVAFGGDKSQGCTLDWESASTLTGDGLEHHSKVYSPYEGEDRTSAGALETHGWAGQHVRIPVTAAYPIEEGATLTVTLPEGASKETVAFPDSPDNWIVDSYYGAPYTKASVSEYFGEPTWDGNVVTFTSVQRIPKNAAFDLRFSAQGDELLGETRATLNGEWDPLQVALAVEPPRVENGEVVNHPNSHAVPDCFRPTTDIVVGNKTDKCEVDWVADAVLDRRFIDWVNNGFIHKVKSPHQTEAPTGASAPGSMELQHYFVGNDTLVLRLPVGTDDDMTDARLVIDLPQIGGHQWQVNDTIGPFYPVKGYTALTPLPSGDIMGNQAVYEIGEFPAGTAFTAMVSMKITPEEFDLLTEPQGEEWSDLFHPSAHLTGTYAEGVEECGAETVPAPGGSAGGSAAIGLGLSALAGSALLSSGSGSAAVPDGSVGDSDQPGGEGPATEITDEGPTGGDNAPATGPVGTPDMKAQAQQQAQNAPAGQGAPAAPAAQPATAPKAQVETARAQESQLANTGVTGILTIVAIGLAAALAGAVLMVRRRA